MEQTQGTQTQTNVTPPSVSFPENWKDHADISAFKEEPSLKNINDIPNLVKGYINAQKMVGQDKIPLPSKHATPGDWKQVFHKLGLPENEADYKVETPKDVQFDENFLKSFTKKAHESNILPAQAKEMLEWYGGFTKQSAEQTAAKMELERVNTVEALKKEWGAAFDNKIEKAKSLFKQFASDGDAKFFNDSGYGNHPAVIKMFAKIAEGMKEDHFPQGGSYSSNKMTPAQAKQEIDRKKADPIYWNAQHPGHKAIVDEVTTLFKMAYPE